MSKNIINDKPKFIKKQYQINQLGVKTVNEKTQAFQQKINK